MNRTFKFVLRRLVQVVPTAIVVVLLSFLILKLAPGDLVDVIAGQDGGATKNLAAPPLAAAVPATPYFAHMETVRG